MRAAASVTIEKQIAQVFTSFADLESRPKYLRSITELKVESEDWVGHGAKWTESRFEDGTIKKGHFSVEQYKPPRVLVLRVSSMGLRYKVRYNFQPEAENTTKVLATIGGQQEGWLGRVMNRFLSQNAAYVHTLLQQELDQFKTFIEAA